MEFSVKFFLAGTVIELLIFWNYDKLSIGLILACNCFLQIVRRQLAIKKIPRTLQIREKFRIVFIVLGIMSLTLDKQLMSAAVVTGG